YSSVLCSLTFYFFVHTLPLFLFLFFFFNDTATTEIYTLSLHDALPIYNGDMYVDGHKAASDVRDEFVSVTEKLMDELAQCYNVLPQLDINNTIDHRPEGDEKWFLENEKRVTQFCRKLGEHIVALDRKSGLAGMPRPISNFVCSFKIKLEIRF